MIERLFDFVKVVAVRMETGAIPDAVTLPSRNSSSGTRNTDASSGVYTAMKRTRANLLAATLRTGLMVVVALILILVLLPAALAAQVGGPR
jgi:hypothetical protein